MKKFMSLSFTFAFLMSIFLQLSHLIVVQSDANLIAQTCKQTPDYNLCVSSLRSDPRSSKADVKGLALIMVGIVNTKASTVPKLINLYLKRSPGLKKELMSCARNYDAILTADIPEAMEALQKGDPKFAENGMNDAANEANSCETQFHGNSPLTNSNKVVHDTSLVAAAIVRLLL